MANPFAEPPGQSTAGQFISAGFGAAPVVIHKDWDYEDAILNGFEINPIAFGCMDRTCSMVSSIPWRFEERVGSKWQPVENSEELALLERPNPKMDLMQLHWFATEALMGGGNALFKKVRIGSRVREMWPMNLVRAQPEVKTGGWIESYQVYEYGRPLRVPAADVLHIMRGMNTLKPFWGRSPMIAARTTVTMANKQIEWNANIPDNLAVPVGAFVDPNLRTTAQVEEAKALVRDRLTGVKHAREPLVLSGGAHWERIGMTPAEIDWIESQKHSVNLTCAALGWLPVIFSGENMTYDNLQTAYRWAWRQAAGPTLKMIRAAYNRDPDLIPERYVGRRRYGFDLSDEPEMLSVMMARFESHERAVKSGIRIGDSIQAHRLPLEIRPEYDRSYVQKGMKQVDGAATENPGDA